MQVHNNSTAFNIWSNFTKNTMGVQKSMGRLSTGIKTVEDDPSGVGISERLRAQARNTATARQNVDNGISLTQTADAWLQKMNDILARMSELTIAANDGTKTETDKDNIRVEFSQMQSELARITSKSTAAAKYNGLYLFRGGNGVAVATGDGVKQGSLTIQIGADTGQTIDLDIRDLQITNTDSIGTVIGYSYDATHAVIGSSRTAVQWGSIIDSAKFSVTSASAIGKVAKAIDHVANARASIGAQQEQLDHARTGLLAYEDNIRAAESKIRDIDVAREATNLANKQILSQVGNAMLAQANQLPSQVLQLLG